MFDITGKSIGRYKILESLGEGGMATVFKATDTQLDRVVAIKMILTTRQQSENILKRFDREARALARLSHPNIIKIYDYGKYQDLPYLVMEYIPGGTLRRLMMHPLPWDEAAELLAPVARGLEYAHQQHIIHRDVKPSNIMFLTPEHPVLTDFGIAKLLAGDETTDLTGTKMGIGTPEYMAPSACGGCRNRTAASVYRLKKRPSGSGHINNCAIIKTHHPGQSGRVGYGKSGRAACWQIPHHRTAGLRRHGNGLQSL